MTFIYNTAPEETTSLTLCRFNIDSRYATTTLDTMQPHHPVDEDENNTVATSSRAKDARHVPWLRTSKQQRPNVSRYRLQRRDAQF